MRAVAGQLGTDDKKDPAAPGALVFLIVTEGVLISQLLLILCYRTSLSKLHIPPPRAQVLNYLLGGGNSFSSGGPGKGMHSRLYTRVLNKYAWVHSCASFNTTFNESGLVGIQVRAEPGGGGCWCSCGCGRGRRPEG